MGRSFEVQVPASRMLVAAVGAPIGNVPAPGGTGRPHHRPMPTAPTRDRFASARDAILDLFIQTLPFVAARWRDRRQHSWPRRVLPAVAIVAIWIAIVALRFRVEEPVEGILFTLTIPIALAAAYYGLLGGLLLATFSTGAFGSWNAIVDVEIGTLGILTRPITFLTIGVGVGLVTDRLEHTRSLLQTVVDGTSDAIYIKDRSSRFVMVNPAGARLLNRDPSEVIGRRHHELVDPLTTSTLFDVDDEVLAGSGVHTVEASVHADGEERVYLATNGPVHDVRGKVVGLFSIARDITERRLLHEHERELAAMRKVEYERAQVDYERLLRHRIANPLAIAIGTAMTLRDVEVPEGDTRDQLLHGLVESLERLHTLSLERSTIGPEESMLDAVARLEGAH